MATKDQNTKRQYLSEEQVETLRAYREVFLSDGGKKVLDDLAKECGFYASKFNEDSNRTAFNCGREELYILINRKIAEANNLDEPLQTEVE